MSAGFVFCAKVTWHISCHGAAELSYDASNSQPQGCLVGSGGTWATSSFAAHLLFVSVTQRLLQFDTPTPWNCRCWCLVFQFSQGNPVLKWCQEILGPLPNLASRKLKARLTIQRGKSNFRLRSGACGLRQPCTGIEVCVSKHLHDLINGNIATHDLCTAA